MIKTERIRTPVSVCLENDTEGNKRPLYIKWKDGRRYEIDRVLDIRRAASTRVGGGGIRYTVRICGKETFLFNDDDIWFVEERV